MMLIMRHGRTRVLHRGETGAGTGGEGTEEAVGGDADVARALINKYAADARLTQAGWS